MLQQAHMMHSYIPSSFLRSWIDCRRCRRIGTRRTHAQDGVRSRQACRCYCDCRGFLFLFVFASTVCVVHHPTTCEGRYLYFVFRVFLMIRLTFPHGSHTAPITGQPRPSGHPLQRASVVTSDVS